ncbi:DeoR/GlpR family DNA-binding transcription regulator [Paratractidigestivibacter sp.]|uniref:DeoR/GlpR family DNA-binding transcription regulator n=1 Tax=Paratractidigestivibacter sp. TaxID=2847316 RepID=UPI002ABD6833|nr:DeoR/GlpR family DNA-binding transcription regulator [Paratractidigestivibacter sp.]
MIKAERHEQIRALLDARGTVSVKEISEALDVSEMTIRRDLEELSSSGDIERVHGGARRCNSPVHSMLRREYTHTEKRDKNAAEKAEAACLAAGLVEEGSTIFLGTGTTVEQMVSYLPSGELRVITNSINVFNLLCGRAGCELFLTGGNFRERTGAFVGPMAESAIAQVGIDAAFVGVNGIVGNDVYTSNMEEGHFQKAAFDQADSRYVVADASKIAVRDFYSFYKLSDIDALVCDGAITPEQAAAIGEFTRVIRPA